jgi:hypothetical protein
MSRLSGRGTPLRAGSPRCCNDRRPGSGSPHPPHGGGSPIRFGLVRQPEAVGPRSGRRCAHQRGSPARSRLPRPDGLVRAYRLKPRLEDLGAKDRRHHGTHDRGGLADPLLRASGEHTIHPCPERSILCARRASTGDQPGRPVFPPFVSRGDLSRDLHPHRRRTRQFFYEDGFRARTKALMNLPSTCGATASRFSPEPASNSRASSIR